MYKVNNSHDLHVQGQQLTCITCTRSTINMIYMYKVNNSHVLHVQGQQLT